MPRNKAQDAGKTPFELERVCSALTAGETLLGIARQHGWAISTLLAWVDADPERSARVKAARMAAARMWDERATEVIEQASNPFELAKAKELAHHYRWRAKAIAPREYGDKVSVDMDARVTDARKLTTEELMEIARRGATREAGVESDSTSGGRVESDSTAP